MRAAGMPPESQAQTMTLAAKVELLRAHFGIANELNVAAVVSTASERLEPERCLDEHRGKGGRVHQRPRHHRGRRSSLGGATHIY